MLSVIKTCNSGLDNIFWVFLSTTYLASHSIDNANVLMSDHQASRRIFVIPQLHRPQPFQSRLSLLVPPQMALSAAYGAPASLPAVLPANGRPWPLEPLEGPCCCLQVSPLQLKQLQAQQTAVDPPEHCLWVNNDLCPSCIFSLIGDSNHWLSVTWHQESLHL